MTRKLTGGQTGYRDAVNEAFRANMHNPSVVYSDRDGFTVQSSLIPLDNDEYRIAEAHYCLNGGGGQNMVGSRSEYAIVRSRLVALLNAISAGKSRRQANDEADDAAYAFDCP